MDDIGHDLPDEAHYLRQVTAMGDKRPVVASEHIDSADGMRLVRAGTRVDSALYDKLLRHKLLRPVDASLNVAEPVAVSTLLSAAKGLLAREHCLAQIVDAAPRHEPLRVLGAVKLNEALAFKLTVCREQFPEKFDHLLRVALTGVFLGDHLRLGDGELVELATAGLFHDLGELHVDPQLFASARQLAPAERRQVYAHPFVAYLILKSFPQYHPGISTAVLDHHERIDGSGYPRGLRGDAISTMGLILAVTELVVVMLERTGSRPDPQRVAAKLKLNLERFGREHVTPFIELMLRQGCGVASGDPADHAITAERLIVRLAELGTALRLPAEQPETPAARFIAEQTAGLRQMAARVGLHFESPADTVALLGEDEAGLAEMEHLARELGYQVVAVVNEVERRWPQGQVDEPVQRWLQTARALGGGGVSAPAAAQRCEEPEGASG